jgi:hypothetical protein
MVGLLWWCGRALEAPSIAEWQRASSWYERVGPATAAAWCVRAVGLALGCWLLVATLVEAVASQRDASPSRALADLIAPRSLQRLVRGLAGLSLTAGLLPAPSAGILDGAPPGVAVLRLVDEPPAEPVAEPSTATLRLRPAVSAPPPSITVREVKVRAGDSLWSLAEGALATSGGERPSDAEVAGYWVRLIELNRHRLLLPANPDLIYPGQVFALPDT